MSEQVYLDLMREIYTHGNRKGDRTGTGTRSLFGCQMRFDLKNGAFPLLTTKKLFTRGIIEELLWFLRGSTNNLELAERDVHIWDDWATTQDVMCSRPLSTEERHELYAQKLGVSLEEAQAMMAKTSRSISRLLDEADIPYLTNEVVVPKGQLGPIYGKQWRAWECKDGRTIDQIAQVIQDLKDRPNSRRHIVSAWNPADLPDERISPQDNVMQGRMALAACHCLFQFYTRPLTVAERYQTFINQGGKFPVLQGLVEQYALDSQLQASVPAGVATREDEKLAELEKNIHGIFEQMGTPMYGLSCRLDQRSADFFLGVPFNIASYAILTAMVAQVCNMAPDEFIWQGGDTHLYNNHFAQVEEQLSRDPRPFPQLRLNPDVRNIDDFKITDFTIEGYEPHGRITAPISV